MYRLIKYLNLLADDIENFVLPCSYAVDLGSLLMHLCQPSICDLRDNVSAHCYTILRHPKAHICLYTECN